MNPPLSRPAGAKLPAISAPIMRLQSGTHHDPFEVLGLHPQPDGATLVRVRSVILERERRAQWVRNLPEAA